MFFISIAFCAYALIGYPLLLALLARWRGRPVRKGPYRATVSIILPVHNGERFIAAKLEAIRALEYPHELTETIVVCDGITDSTHELVRNFAGLPNLTLLDMPRGGKAAALNAAIARATGEILFFTDVRQYLDPGSLASLVTCFADPEVGVASGELIIRDSDTLDEASVGMYWKYEKWIRKQLSRLDSVPGATGCIYAMRRTLATSLPPETLNDDMYLPLGAFFRGYRVILDDSARAYDYPTALGNEFRRKVRTLAGVYQIVKFYPALLGPRNRIWIHFFSHKFARLLMPWALIAAALSTYFLPPHWNLVALNLQVAAYLLAAVDTLLPSTSPMKRLTAPLRTFVVLMAASLCAVAIVFVPARMLWRETRVSAQKAAAGEQPASGG